MVAHAESEPSIKQARRAATRSPITIDADTVGVVALVGGTVIADTRAAPTLREVGYPPVHYIPVDDVVPGTLRPSTSHSYGPYEGDAFYYDVVLPDGTELRDVAWTYAAPSEGRRDVAH